jgi:UDP-N-acetylglucosamine diphosphorylase / glucose-1-phosphate thymidylyltransferase / UDP-N-acetylgalactosamine diphosphorylase / glucosamine-1-phosphate N-acetyltransferase / galactosamine-1-phosphate N-acetyltransferase
MYNIIVPMAGLGSRFLQEGYTDPKPFIKINGTCIVEYSLASLKLPGIYYIITQKLDNKYKDILLEILERRNINSKIIELPKLTSGAAETCYCIKDQIPPLSQLITTNCDHFTPWDPQSFIDFINNSTYDAIVTTYDHEPILLGSKMKYSFIKTDSNGLATEFSEKLAISHNSLNGIHYWRSANLFFDSANELLQDNSLVQEKYISLTFNYLIKKGLSISYFKMPKGSFYSLGTPEEVNKNLAFLDIKKL